MDGYRNADAGGIDLDADAQLCNQLSTDLKIMPHFREETRHLANYLMIKY
jgi:hypothetical protein